uniref:Uncharacterized protein n=1 Tax=Kalanchoe fedtschenkoi TaxID=63787 RepID=A0A7N1A7V2_KALFE
MHNKNTRHFNQAEQQPTFLTSETSSFVPTLIVCPLGMSPMGSSLGSSAFRLTTRYIWVSTSVKAFSTLRDSRAEVSIKKMPCFCAKAVASSTETARRWRKSALLPTSIMTIWESVWPRSSVSHLSIFSNVMCRVMS